MTFFKGFFERLTGWHLVLAVALFWSVVPLVDRTDLFDMVNALSCAIGIGILTAYIPGLVQAWQRGERFTDSHLLVFGMLFSWFGVVCRNCIVWYWRLNGRPDEVIDSPWNAFTIFLIFLGGSLHLWVRDEPIKGEFPKRNWTRVGVFVAIGVFVGLSVALLMDPTHHRGASHLNRPTLPLLGTRNPHIR